MSKDDELLLRFSVASPCPMSFADMTGDDKVRFCQRCSKNVHNLSNMSKAEAAEVIRKSDGKICAFISRDAKGKILTENCPEFLRAARNKLRDRTANIASGLAVAGVLPAAFMFSKLISGGGGGTLSPSTEEITKTITPSILSAWASFKLLTLAISKFRLGKGLERFIFGAIPFAAGIIIYCFAARSHTNFPQAVMAGLLLAGSTYGFACLLTWLKRSTDA